MGSTSFLSWRAISASGKIVPAPVPLPPVPIRITTEWRLQHRLDVVLRFLQRLAGDVRVVPRPKPAGRARPDQQRSSTGRSESENSFVSRKRVVSADRGVRHTQGPPFA